MKKILFAVLCLSFVYVFTNPTPLHARITLNQLSEIDPDELSESIIEFESYITVLPDGTLDVTERIAVLSKGFSIKRGIYRDFPTRYKDANGNRYTVDFTPKSLKRNGIVEPFFTENIGRGVRVNFGDDSLIPKGFHIYELNYTTSRQIGFFDDHDELYWNVTGHDWAFPILFSNAYVRLPATVDDDELATASYTGRYGSTGSNAKVTKNATGATYSTRDTLRPGEGFTIVLEWPKGLVQEPTAEEKRAYFFEDNKNAFILFSVALILLLYFLIVWKKVGDDPESGTIIPQYEPPHTLSPALMHYVSKMRYTPKAFTAAIINMAIKGYYNIEEMEKLGPNNFHITKNIEKSNLLSPDEKIIDDNLIPVGGGVLIARKNNTLITSALNSHQRHIKRTLGKSYFKKNSLYSMIGIALSVFGFFLSEEIDIAFAFIAATGLIVLITAMIRDIVISLSGNSAKRAIKVIISLFFLISMTTGIVLTFTDIVINQINTLYLFATISIILTNVIFLFLLPSRTVFGREQQDIIDGFKLFLTVTEKDRLNFHNPPEKTPELFEKNLAYALALGVEHEWAEQFSDVFKHLAETGTAYNPHWYRGANFNSYSITSFTSSLSSSFSSTIASVHASQTSGGAGGFSGGGGGGGGGGGR